MTAMHDTDQPDANWGGFLMVLLGGVAGGMQIGKIPPLLDGMRIEFTLSLVAAGLLASSFNLIGAGFGILGGTVSDRLGGRQAQASGVALMALGNLLGAMASDSFLLIGGRLVEGVGFVLAVVAGPSRISAMMPQAKRKLALGLWSTYMPAGVAMGLLITPPLSLLVGWRGVWLLMAAVLALLAIAMLRTGSDAASPGAPRVVQWSVLRRPSPWLLAGCFACYTTQWFSIVTWLPTYLREAGTMSDATIALCTALVVMANLIGTTGAAALMHRGVPRWLLMAMVSIGMSICGILVFSSAFTGLGKVAMAFVASGFGGMLPASVLASVPLHARHPQEIATVNGVVVQVLNFGSFIGPPLLAALVAQLGGWSEGRWLLLAAGAGGLALALMLRRIERHAEIPA